MVDEAIGEGNIEISQALKEFDAKSQADKSPVAEKVPVADKDDVSGVKFDLPTYGAVKYYKETATPKMVDTVMKLSHGTIKNQKQAEWILVGVVVIFTGIAIYLFITANEDRRPTITPQMIEQMKKPK